MPTLEPNMALYQFLCEVAPETVGRVIIKSIAYQPGLLALIAVDSSEPCVDPVAICNASNACKLTDYLHVEELRFVRWSDMAEAFVENALYPVRVEQVYKEMDQDLGRPVTKVVMTEEQFELACEDGSVLLRLVAQLVQQDIEAIFPHEAR